jgi:hypothetical protein
MPNVQLSIPRLSIVAPHETVVDEWTSSISSTHRQLSSHAIAAMHFFAHRQLQIYHSTPATNRTLSLWHHSLVALQDLLLWLCDTALKSIYSTSCSICGLGLASSFTPALQHFAPLTPTSGYVTPILPLHASPLALISAVKIRSSSITTLDEQMFDHAIEFEWNQQMNVTLQTYTPQIGPMHTHCAHDYPSIATKLTT